MPVPKRTTPSSTSRRLGSPEHKHGGASCIHNLQVQETVDKLCKMQNRMHELRTCALEATMDCRAPLGINESRRHGLPLLLLSQIPLQDTVPLLKSMLSRDHDSEASVWC